MAMTCGVCDHIHEEDGTCECGCAAEEQVELLCVTCGHEEHDDRGCRCGCLG